MNELDLSKYKPSKLAAGVRDAIKDIQGVEIVKIDRPIRAGKTRLFGDPTLSSEIDGELVKIVIRICTEKALKSKIADVRGIMATRGYRQPEKECKWQYLASTTGHTEYQAYLSYSYDDFTRALLLKAAKEELYYVIFQGKCLNQLKAKRKCSVKNVKTINKTKSNTK